MPIAVTNLRFRTGFFTKFERNNTGGKKNLKCFPHCREEGHRPHSWCGATIVLEAAWPEPLSAVRAVAVLTETAVGGICGLPVKTGHALDLAAVVGLAAREEVFTPTICPAGAQAAAPAAGDDGAEVMAVEGGARLWRITFGVDGGKGRGGCGGDGGSGGGWNYPWRSHRSKVNCTHCFRVAVFVPCAQGSAQGGAQGGGGAGFVCAATADSPPFKITSSRAKRRALLTKQWSVADAGGAGVKTEQLSFMQPPAPPALMPAMGATSGNPNDIHTQHLLLLGMGGSTGGGAVTGGSAGGSSFGVAAAYASQGALLGDFEAPTPQTMSAEEAAAAAAAANGLPLPPPSGTVLVRQDSLKRSRGLSGCSSDGLGGSGSPSKLACLSCNSCTRWVSAHLGLGGDAGGGGGAAMAPASQQRGQQGVAQEQVVQSLLPLPEQSDAQLARGFSDEHLLGMEESDKLMSDWSMDAPGAVGQTPTAGGTAAGSGSFSLSFPTFGDQHYLSADQQRGHSWGSVGSSAALSAAAQSAVSSVV
jgi:hypothetical protein